MGVFIFILFAIVISCTCYLIHCKEKARRKDEQNDLQSQVNHSPYASWEEIEQMKHNAQLEKKVQALQNENMSLSADNQRLKEALKKSENTDSSAEQLYLKNTISDLEKDIKKLEEEKGRISYENQKLQRLNVANDNLKKDIEKLQAEKNNLLKENRRFAEDQTKKYQNTTINNLSKEIDLLQKKNNNLLQENGNYIKENRELTEQVHQFNPYDDYRKRFPSPYRCDDGDWVRSKAEREIDNFFYRHRIWHIIEEAYYKKNSNIQYYPDFYLPDYNLYLEYFGGTDPDYLFKKESKIATYRADHSIRFEYLTFQDDSRIEERLREICRKYSIPL